MVELFRDGDHTLELALWIGEFILLVQAIRIVTVVVVIYNASFWAISLKKKNNYKSSVCIDKGLKLIKFVR